MKRFLIIFLLLTVVLGVMAYFAPKSFAVLVPTFPKKSKVYVYCGWSSLESVNMGNGYLVECDAENFYDTLQQCSGIDGISVKFGGTRQDFDNLIRQFGLSDDVQMLGELSVVCGNSKLVRGGVILDGQLVNVQIAFDGETVTVGYPLILDSF